MTLSSLLTLNDNENDVSQLVTDQGLTLLEHFKEIGIECESFTLDELKQHIDDLDEDTRRVFLTLEIEGGESFALKLGKQHTSRTKKRTEFTSDDTVNIEEIASKIRGDTTGNKNREIIGMVFSLTFVAMCVLVLVTTCWVAYVKKEPPEFWLTVMTLSGIWGVVWFYMGLINNERKNILSAIFGDKLDINETVKGFMSRRK